MDPHILDALVALAESMKGPLVALLIGGAIVVGRRRWSTSPSARETDLLDDVENLKRHIDSLHDEVDSLHDRVDTTERPLEGGRREPTPV